MDCTFSTKSWLVVFHMWDKQCKILHKNDWFDKVQNIEYIDYCTPSSLLQNRIELYQYKHRVFYNI